jgi:uncharacterized membrane protein YqjE
LTDDTPGTGSAPGLRGAVTRLGAAALALLRNRAELASVEFAEERARAKAQFVLLVVAMLAFSFALLALSALVVVCFWETHRLAALAALVVFYLAIGAVAMWRIGVAAERTAPPFAGTLAELERDREWLARRMGSGR